MNTLAAGVIFIDQNVGYERKPFILSIAMPSETPWKFAIYQENNVLAGAGGRE